MPLQNRVDPFSKLHAVTNHGLFLGNRGILHNDQGELETDRWRTPAWIICTLTPPKSVTPHKLMTPGKYTHLFFMDEATALAAGHRPCAYCRRDAWNTYRAALNDENGPPMASDIKDQLFGEMREYILKFGSKPRPAIRVAELPDGAMFAIEHQAYLKWNAHAHPWSFSGYGAPESLPETAIALTPKLNRLALANGYTPALHSSLQT